MLHFNIGKVKRVVAAILVVGKVIRKEDVELGTGVIIFHLVEEFHGSNSNSIS
mgnify:CR=1 FL=1